METIYDALRTKQKDEVMPKDTTEHLLRNINEKLKNRHNFTWKFMFGWMIAIPFMIFSLLFIDTGFHGRDDVTLTVGIIFGIIAFLAFVINLILGVISLYKSTKDIE